MRNNRAIVLGLAAVILVLVAAGTPLHAQKVAIVASEAIFDRLPDAKTARSKLAEMHTTWMREIQRQETEIQRLQGDIQANRLLWSTQEQQDAQARLADMESKLSTYRTSKYGANGEFERTQTELMGPIQDKVSKAIDEEAKSQKYDIVLDKSSRATLVLYVNPSYDITYQVLKRLGVEVPASDMPTDPSAAGGAGKGGSEANAMRNRGRRDDPTDTPKVVDPNDLLKGGGQNQPGTQPANQSGTPDGTQPDGQSTPK